MIRCTKCGAKNAEDARYCVQCGAPFNSLELGHERYNNDDRDLCFGATRRIRYFWILVGLIIILWGLSDLLKIYFRITIEAWPFILILIGIYIIYRALSRYRRA